MADTFFLSLLFKCMCLSAKMDLHMVIIWVCCSCCYLLSSVKYSKKNVAISQKICAQFIKTDWYFQVIGMTSKECRVCKMKRGKGQGFLSVHMGRLYSEYSGRPHIIYFIYITQYIL